MNKNYKAAFLVLFGLILILSGCGGSSGEMACAPGSDMGDTGICIRSVSVIGDEPAGGDDEIDVRLHYCDDELTELEPGLFMVYANMTIQTATISFDPISASVEECTVTYLKGNENPEAPIIENMTVYPNCTLLNGSNECIVQMMDVNRKWKFWEDFTTLNTDFSYPYNYPWHYVARFECVYVSGNEAGSFDVEYDIWLADWDYC